MAIDSLEVWMRSIVSGTASIHPSQIPDDVLERLADEGNAMTKDSFYAQPDPDPSANAALMAVAVSVAARKGSRDRIKRTVAQLLELQKGIAVQVSLERMRRRGVCEVVWPDGGFLDLDEKVLIRPAFSA